ncbi:uncharacterized protein LOC107175678 [Citrus sinensis]|uniref:uncharacterized protein LOC107175678 n=1 Tax=Citrus sinensis TaxID=2711 RepID=UPI0007638F2D|nr:uncharacterized protein LOC107175678 [Citrus sinensis]
MELKNMKQREQETLREFIKRFYRVVLDLGAFNHPQALRGLKEELKIRRLWYNLRSLVIQTFAAAYEQVKRDIEIKDEKAARIKTDQLEGLGRKEKRALPGNEPIKRKDHHASGSGTRGWREQTRSAATASNKERHKQGKGSAHDRPKPGLWVVYFLEDALDEVYETIKDRELLYHPTPITKLPSRRDRGRYCKFHGAHGHTTTECRDLKTQVEDLVRNRYLDEFIDEIFPMVASTCEGEQSNRNLSHEQLIVRVIPGGPTLAGDSNRSRKNYTRYAMTSKEVFFNTPAAKRVRFRQVLIMWTDEDEKGILYPHEDALVIKVTAVSRSLTGYWLT